MAIFHGDSFADGQWDCANSECVHAKTFGNQGAVCVLKVCSIQNKK